MDKRIRFCIFIDSFIFKKWYHLPFLKEKIVILDITKLSNNDLSMIHDFYKIINQVNGQEKVFFSVTFLFMYSDKMEEEGGENSWLIMFG